MWTVNAPRAPNGNGPNIAANTRPCEYRYTTHPPTSLRSPDPPSRLYYDQGTHIWLRNPWTFVLSFIYHLLTPSSHARAHVCATFCSKILRSLESIKSPQNIVSYFSCTLWRLQACVWVLARIYMATVMSKEIIRFLKTFISTIIFCTLKINIIPNLFVNLRFPHSWQYYVLLRI